MNIILVIIVYLQLRLGIVPRLSVKIISKDKVLEGINKSDVLEQGELYIMLSNYSKYIAKDIKLKYTFIFEKNINKAPIIKKFDSLYLNPNERIKELLNTEEIQDKYPDLFEKITKNRTLKTIPKKTLKIRLKIEISYKPSSLPFRYERLQDEYSIEWGSLKNNPDFKTHPIFFSWNKRKGNYIYKIIGK